MSHEVERQYRRARGAMDLYETALEADGDSAALIAGAPEPQATRRLALGMLAVGEDAGAVFEPDPPD